MGRFKNSFFCFIQNFKITSIFNFNGNTSIQTFKSIFVWEILVYLIVLSITFLLVGNFIYNLVLPIVICLYNIQFYALISRTLNGKFLIKKKRNIALSIATLLLSLFSIIALFVYFYYIHDNLGVNLVNHNGIALVLMIGMYLTPVNLIIRTFLVAAVYV